MESEAFTSLSHRTLSTQHRLSHQACCPTMDLAVLTSPSTGSHSDQSGPSHDTITCFRLSGSTPQVWSVCVSSFFTDNCACIDLLGHHVEINPESRLDQITALHWSPDGQSLVAGLSSRSMTGSPMFILLSVHSGQLLAFPTVVTSSDLNLQSTPLRSDQPSNQTNKLDFLGWLSLRPSKNATQESAGSPTDTRLIGQSMCDNLPASLTVPQLSKIETIRNHLGPVYTSNPSGGNSKLYDHYPMIRFPPCLIGNQHQPNERPKTSSLLVISTHVNTLHFFLDGTVYMGTTSLPNQVQLIGTQLLEQDAPLSVHLDEAHQGGVRLQLVWLDMNHSIGLGTLDLLPTLVPSHPSSNKSALHLNLSQSKQRISIIGIHSVELNLQAQLSNEIQSLLKESFFAYFGIVKDWHIARITAKKWYENLEQLSKTHKVVEPISFQMLQLLFLGQTSESIRDFLGTKSGDRIFTKWESAVTGSLTRIRLAIIELFVPAIERLYILITELRLHTYPQFSSIKMIEDEDFETLLVVENLIKHLIRAVHLLDQLVKDEEELFGHFCKWLRSEFEYIVALETAPAPPSRPLIKYDIMAVSKFIQRGEANPLDNVIFSQFRSKTEDFKYLQTVKEQLSKTAYDDHFDINGPENRTELKKKLGAVLSFSDQDNSHSVDENNEERYEQLNNSGSPILGHYVTPDTSHFHQPHPNVEFLTPSFGDHLRRQKEVTNTPSNAAMFKPLPSSIGSGSNPQFSSNSHQSSHSEVNPNPASLHQQPWGIYNSLSYSSTLIAEVFVKMFSKTAMAKPIEEQVLKNNSKLLKPTEHHLCSRFVDDFHYSGFLRTGPEATQVLVIDQIQLPPSQTKTNPTKVPDPLLHTQVTIQLNIPSTYVHNDWSEKSTIEVLDLDFFDDFEVVILAQFDTGFSAKYMLITIMYQDLFQSDQRQLSEIPVYRVHRLGSDYRPDQISLNGVKGRRTGCVLSGSGKMLNVFDMEDTS
ncbi:hypothetical protein PSTG_05703 [Puccinia striiformis f. sp. tritici PST-78]|uniref:Anaphase-promoting complex subunit 4 n=1 Tax=Puccinia striiformis f. sp. tritici PST-78 TaxID=1165861 RepID=A0A0L0VP64_9BASI|nr:hypothetical protein PSTG_05703 [Puccinia striiformis f. sp. tritici PST-78]